MSIYITPQDELHVEYQGIALTCPHCSTLTHLTAVAVPKFEDLSRRRPKHIGIVFRCDTCVEPIFLKFAAKAEAAGLKVVMNRCPKIEYGRLSSEISWMGVNSRTISAKRAPIPTQGMRLSLDRMSVGGGATAASDRAARDRNEKS